MNLKPCSSIIFLLREHPRSDEFIRHVTNKFVTTWRVFIVSGRRSRHERLLRKHPRSDEFIRHVTNKFVTTWRVFIVKGRRSQWDGLMVFRSPTSKKPFSH